MWLQFVENPTIIKAIYKDKPPSLENIELQEIRIVNGENLQCYLRLHVIEIPEKLPQKWLDNNVNAVQMEWLLINTKILFFETIGNDLIGKLDVFVINDIKRITFSVNQKKLLVLECKWITINSVNGYMKHYSAPEL